jgi:Rieske Fe-S protein
MGLVAASGIMIPAPASGSSRAHRPTGARSESRYTVPSTDSVEVDRKQEVILVRHGGVIAAFALSCPHQRSMLRWREKDGIFQCTKHHSEYAPTGEYLRGRATRNMDRLAIQLDGADVVVDSSRVVQSDSDAAGWAAAAVNLPPSQGADQ